MTSTYPVPVDTVETETEVKKSRFIARATRAISREEALAFVERARRDFPDARHHCWAYLLGNPSSASSAAMSDDGEPSGTAGKPILNVISHKGVGDVVVVVIRYFGGIKLGAGGLVRAYSGAAEAAMSTLTIEQAVSTQHVLLTMDFSREQMLRHWLGQHQGEIVTVEYGAEVAMEVNVPEMALQALHIFCAAQSVAIAAGS